MSNFCIHFWNDEGLCDKCGKTPEEVEEETEDWVEVQPDLKLKMETNERTRLPRFDLEDPYG